ncbi:MAG: zinc ribbon domain-containing protein [Thermoplasmata archaeon]|nr:zinc ribbon domain-containing protein [Thermoplasmata archaeon]
MPFCPVCGGRLSPGEPICSHCGANVEDMIGIIKEWSSREGERGIEEERCIECGSKATGRCFFCSAPICERHSYSMRITSMNVGIGDTVKVCFLCVKKREGTTPTVQEAERAGVYFNVKPYYEWRRV